MGTPKNLTKDQIKELAKLEPRLRRCVQTADLKEAKIVAAKIQGLLRPTGHETRILQAKNWLFETALEANSLTYAKMGFEGTIQKSNSRTRLHLEALSLLAICYLREKNIDKARSLIFKAIDNISNIKSADRRKQFHRRLISRLEDESILVGLASEEFVQLDAEKVDLLAIEMVRTKSQDQILLEMGQAVPRQSLNLLTQVREAYQLRLPAPDRKMLPPPINEDSKQELGARASSALKRVAWRALCSPNSEIYKAWSQGLSVVYDKKYIAAAIIGALGSLSISATMLAASATALAIKFGAEVFCEMYAPESIMIGRNEKS